MSDLSLLITKVETILKNGTKSFLERESKDEDIKDLKAIEHLAPNIKAFLHQLKLDGKIKTEQTKEELQLKIKIDTSNKRIKDLKDEIKDLKDEIKEKEKLIKLKKEEDGDKEKLKEDKKKLEEDKKKLEKELINLDKLTERLTRLKLKRNKK